jgi:SAM-dependent methyltransferase
MNPDEAERLREKYDRRLAQFGHSPQTLGWTKPKHLLRYKVLLDYWNLGGEASQSLLDFGCGFGDMYGFARELHLNIEYFGVDLNANLIGVARQAYPDARFWTADPLSDGLDRPYDIIVASGTHNYLLADNRHYIERTFDLFSKHSKRGFAVNFLSDQVNVRNKENFYANPEATLGLALQYSRRVQLRHDYMPFEFTIFVDKAENFSEELTVFSEYEPWCAQAPAVE